MDADVLVLLLLGDGRFPAGGHAHSAGVEAAVADGRICGVEDVEAFARGRLWTAGLTDAALAAATVDRLGRWEADMGAVQILGELDAEADARISPPALRSASRRLGRQLARAAARCWPAPVLDAAGAFHPVGPHQSVALGATGAACGLAVQGVAAVAVHHAITTPVQAAVRLLGLDPFDAASVVARLSVEGAAVVEVAVSVAGDPLADLPCRAGPLADIAAVHHAGSDRRLFAT